MAKKKVYLETSVISYLTARPNRDVVKLAKQELTRQWWEQNRSAYDFYVSDPVLVEIRRGDADAAQQRLDIAAELPVLIVTDAVTVLYECLFAAKILPDKARADALHIAIAAVHGMTYLATWNCAHINNATLREKIAGAVLSAGYNEVILKRAEISVFRTLNLNARFGIGIDVSRNLKRHRYTMATPEELWRAER